MGAGAATSSPTSLCAVSASFTLLLVARVFGGAMIAASRVATVALVRDCYHGRAMARVMSIAFMVFMIVPVLAPTFGQTVLLFGDWRGDLLDDRRRDRGGARLVLRPDARDAAARATCCRFRSRAIARGLAHRRSTDRLSIGYTLAAAMLMGALYGYLNSVQQIMFDTFERPALLAVMFAATAALMAVANLTNARIVMRLGTRLISHARGDRRWSC